MKIKKNKSLIFFLIYFIFWFGFSYLMERKNPDWNKILIISLIYASVMTLAETLAAKIFSGGRLPIYLKVSDYEQILEELKKLDAEFLKTKGEKSIYRIKGKRWPLNKITVKKTPFYVMVETPGKYMDAFLQLDLKRAPSK